EGAGVFEVAADDAAHADVFAEALDAGHEAADAAHDEVDAHAGLGGGVEVVNGGLAHQGVHLGEDARGASGEGVLLFAPDEFLEAFVQVVGGDEQVGKLGGAAEAGEGVEERGDVGGELLVGGEGA